MTPRQEIRWVAVPAGIDGAARLSVFVAPQLAVSDVDDPTDLTLAAYPDLVDWPATLARLRLEIEVEGGAALPVRADGARSATWTTVFGTDTRVAPFVPDDPVLQTVVNYDAGAIVDTLSEGYGAAAVVDVPEESPWDPGFWRPEVWDPGYVPPADHPLPDDLDDGIPDVPDEPGTGEGGQEIPEPGTDGPSGGEIPEVDQPGHGGEVYEPEIPVGSIPGFDLNVLFPAVIDAVNHPDNQWLTGTGTDFTASLAQRSTAAQNAVSLGETPNAMLFAEPAGQADAWAQFVGTNRVLQTFAGRDAGQQTFLTADQRAEQRERLVHAFDLHRILGALGDHPALLRALGLVLDVTVPADTLPAQGRLRVRVRWDDAGPAGADRVDTTPWTVFRRTGDTFTAATRSGAVPGLVHLDGAYRVEQLDLEAAGHAVHALVTGNSSRGDTVPALPLLRTAGLRLFRQQRANALLAMAQNANGNRAADDVELYAEDLVRGHRLDVLDDTVRRWRSLHARVATYRVEDTPLLTEVADEGMFHAGYLGAPLDAGASHEPGAVIVVGDALVSWDGWSLAAPRPGRVISADPLDREPVTQVTDPLTSTRLGVDVGVAPGSLPRLRFGRSYRLRLRTVDIAGNGPALTAADAAVAEDDALPTAPVVFRRYEPVPPPEITYVTAPPDPLCGENERRVVVRSGLDDGDLTFGAGPGLAERVLFPPKCSVRIAELHGMFDAAMSPAGRVARADTYRTATRENGVLCAGVTTTPYLPDPQSAGVCLAGVPGLGADETLTMAWPALDRPITLRLVAGEAARPDVDETTGTVTIHLPAAARATVRMSSMIADPELMALLAWCRERLPAAELAEVESKVRAHRHHMFTPHTTVELVHAVQRPLSGPDAVDGIGVQPRTAEQTHTRYAGTFATHAPSTASIELHASWRDLLDEFVAPEEVLTFPGYVSQGWYARQADVATELGARVEVAQAQPGTSTRELGFYTGSAIHVPPLELGDTKFREITFTARATSRFAEFFPPSYAGSPADGTPSRLVRDGSPRTVVVPSTRRPPAPDVVEVLPLVTRTAEADGVLVQEGGWLRIWLARPWHVSGAGEQLGVLLAARQPGMPTDPAYPFVTLAAPDPARTMPWTAGEPAGGIEPGHLAGWTGAPERVTVPELPGELYLATYQAGYDRGRDTWFADVRVAIPNGYFPFVRLALVRWQPRSIVDPDCRMSPGVTVDPVQVLPDRRLTVTRAPGSVRIALTGPSFESRLQFGGLPAPADGSAWRVTVRAQRKVRDDDLLGWETVFDHALEPPFWPAATIDVSGDFTIGAADGTPWRLLVVQEDFAASGTYPDQSGLIPRVVFAETVAVDGPPSV
jgi:hypothetical protein